MKTYSIVDKHKYDQSKNSLILFLLERNLGKKTNFLSYSYILNVVNILKKDFNIFLIARSSSATGAWIEVAKQTPVLKDCIYINLDATGKFTRVETGEKDYYHDDILAYNYTYDYMENLFDNFINDNSWIFDNLVGTISSAVHLVYERNHEIIPYDERTEKLVESAKQTAIRRMTNQQQFFSFRMISQRNLYPLHFLLRLMKDYPNLWHYSFCHDTSSVWYPWSAKVNPFTKNVKCFYFVDDNRGPLRDFKEFPSGPIQDACGRRQPTKDELNMIIKNKNKDFIFGGTFPYDVSYRLNDWLRFFDNLDCDATILTQTDGQSTITMTEIKDPIEQKKFKNKKIKDEKAFEVIKKISQSKYVIPTVPQDEYHKMQKDYLFTIILKCFYGKYDSLNFRIYSSLANGIIPLIADDYDIDNLQIPEYFKKQLVVSNNSHIEDMVAWARKYPESYKKLFWELYDYYIKPEHYNISWYTKIFREKYFNEIY